MSYRYERKSLISSLQYFELIHFLKKSPNIFTVLYPKRIVNNIYFDTMNMSSFSDAVEGSTKRVKIRIRWYGDLYGEINNPVLEIKIKKGSVGTKEHYPLKSFIFSGKTTNKYIKNFLKNSHLPPKILELVKQVSPVLVNRYERDYFQDCDNQFRITIDKDVRFYNISSFGIKNVAGHIDHLILELKYGVESENRANEIFNKFPFRLTKSSKFTNGLDLINSFI